MLEGRGSDRGLTDDPAPARRRTGRAGRAQAEFSPGGREMMGVPDLAGVLVGLGVLLGVPLILGAVAPLLAGSEGAGAGPHLPAGRRLIAAGAGGLLGCLALAATAVAGLSAALS